MSLEELVRGLTKAQRRALALLYQAAGSVQANVRLSAQTSHKPRTAHKAATGVLVDRGLAEYARTEVHFSRYARITDLGVIVAAELERREQSDDY